MTLGVAGKSSYNLVLEDLRGKLPRLRVEELIFSLRLQRKAEKLHTAPTPSSGVLLILLPRSLII